MKGKKNNPSESNIQNKPKLRELTTNFEILHKQNLYVTIWMVLDGLRVAIKYKRQRWKRL